MMESWSSKMVVGALLFYVVFLALSEAFVTLLEFLN